MDPELSPGSPRWRDLADRVAAARPDLLVLNEMPFGPWIAARPTPDPGAFDDSCRAHEEGIARLGELGAPLVVGTRPARRRGLPVNEVFAWTPGRGPVPVRTKQYFPDEEGYYEARWFSAGSRRFAVHVEGALGLGVLVCTEVMFNEHARALGRRGANVLVVPRAVGAATLDRWLVAMRMAAIVSGCFVLTSNRSGRDGRGQEFGGHGWVVDPTGAEVAATSAGEPVVVRDLDLRDSARAHLEYPCTVPELTPPPESGEPPLFFMGRP